MSEARIAALVCEGQTDVPILRSVIQALWPEIEEVRSLQPQLDEMGRARGPAGWSQVKSWCEQNAKNLDEGLDPDVGDPMDLLLIAIDVDIAVAAGIANPPSRVGLYETTRLRNTVRRWLRPDGGTGRVPTAIVVTTPVMAIEAWIVAAIFPRARSPEGILDGAQFLVDKSKLRSSDSDGKPWKELHKYRDFAGRVARSLGRVRKACFEAERACSAIEQRRDQLTQIA
jgi:hypothetical protein